MKENKTKRSYEIDMCSGPLFSKIVLFALPLMASGVLQLLFNAADIIVVGRFAGSQSMAAVGSNGALINLMVNVFIGLSIGANVLVARYYGARDEKNLEETVHTAMVIAVVGGLLLIAIGELLTKPILILMGSPEDVLPLAVLYMKIYFLGMPGTLVYNFGSAILRAVGDTRRPLYFLLTAGVVNVIFNLIFVIAFSMDVAGVGWATVISQGVSGLLCLFYMKKKFTVLKMQGDEWRPHKHSMMMLCGMGIPMGLQYSITAIGSVILQTAVNTLGSVAVASVTAGGKIGTFFCCPFDAMGATMATYGGQNVGAKKLDRISRGLRECVLLGAIYSVIAFVVIYFFSDVIALLFVDASETEILHNTRTFLLANVSFYFPLALVNIVRFMIQGLGYSRLAILAGVCEMIARSAVAFWLVPVLGYDGACLANPAAWIAADLFLIPAYLHVMKHLKYVVFSSKDVA